MRNMQVGEASKVKFNLFRNKFEFACGDHGLTLEKIGGGICCYATDASHEEIYCAMPLGMEREFKDANYYVYALTATQMLLRVHKAVLLIDFAQKHCATNVPHFRVYGSKAWGQDCLVPWQSSYTQLYNEAEKKRLASRADA